MQVIYIIHISGISSIWIYGIPPGHRPHALLISNLIGKGWNYTFVAFHIYLCTVINWHKHIETKTSRIKYAHTFQVRFKREKVYWYYNIYVSVCLIYMYTWSLYTSVSWAFFIFSPWPNFDPKWPSQSESCILVTSILIGSCDRGHKSAHTEYSGYSLPIKVSTTQCPNSPTHVCNVTLNVSNLYSTFWVDLPTGSMVKEIIWVQHNFNYILLVGTYIQLGELFVCVFNISETNLYSSGHEKFSPIISRSTSSSTAVQDESVLPQ